MAFIHHSIVRFYPIASHSLLASYLHLFLKCMIFL
uniref:Uncharacterized protein n=1 Tax=Arundo donax TaxID=35708 RepID=A0A0A9EQE2_ARUDO